MAKIKVRAPNPKGYPTSDKVARGCRYTAQVEPSDVFLTCTAQLHNLSKQRTAAVLQVLKINTLAGQWILRDIREHKPEQRFAPFRKPKSTKYVTNKIYSAIKSRYREHVRSRYTLNSYIFGGLCTTLASMTSSYLQKVTEARQKGLIEQYEQCARYQITFGKHKGDTLGSLGRKTIFGYAFITPRRE